MATQARRGRRVLVNFLARMLPLKKWQSQVYHLADKFPPGFTDGFAPNWQVVDMSLSARTTDQVRLNVQREFHLLSLAGSSGQAGGFRMQLYDQKKKRRISERGVSFNNFTGPGSAPFFLREPYAMTEREAQFLVVIQNQDTSVTSNAIQAVLYGVARRFNFPQ